MPKKILIVTEYFYPEGFKIHELAREWKNKGYEVDVLTQNPTYPYSEVFEGYDNKWFLKEEWDGINIYRVKAVTGYKKSLFKKLLKYFVFMFLASIVSVYIGKKYDYIFGFNMAALTGMFPAIILKKLYKKPITFWAQDIWPDSVYAYGFKKTRTLSYFLDKFVGFMYRNVDNIAISGKGFETKLKPYVKDNIKFNYLPNWADELDDKMEAFSFSKDKKVHFTFAGNVGKVQNLDNVIQAFISLPEIYKQRSQLNIIGDGSHLESLKKMYQDDTVIYHGRKPREDMAKYFKGSDFLIVSLINKPIFSVTVPAKTQTYIAAKKPILAIIDGEGASIVKENNLGYVANPDNLKEIVNIYIKSIDMNGKEKAAMTANCEKLTSTIFNKEKIIDKLLQLTIQGKD